MFKFDFKCYVSLLICVLLCTCSGRGGGYTHTNMNKKWIQTAEIDVKENPDSHFFSFSPNSFEFSQETKKKLSDTLREARAKGVDNVGFLIISPNPISLDDQNRIKNNIREPMYEFGFIESRIIDSGTCVYPKATPGVRINILDYDIETPDMDEWTDAIGDADPDKHLPKMGVSDNYNLEQMIANKADLISPRRYKGQRTQDAMDAIGGTSSGSGGSSGSSSSRSSSRSSSFSSSN